MTVQASDQFLLDGRTYEIIDGLGAGLVYPKRLGLEPVGASSACWRGYVSTYSLQGEQLVLENLDVCLYDMQRRAYEPLVGHEINGIQPRTRHGEFALFNNEYVGIRLPAPYTGSLVIADDVVDAAWTIGWPFPPWAYRTVVELFFFRGRRFFSRSWNYHALVLRFLSFKWERLK